jgi:diguanylate cyclase (GGDEF)-like protein
MLMFAVLATLLPSLTTVWISYIENKRALQAKASEELLGVTAQAVREIDLWAKELRLDLKVFTSSYEVTENLERIPLQNGEPSRAGIYFRRLSDYIHSVRDRFPDYNELLVLDPHGHLVATSSDERRGVQLPANWAEEMRVHEVAQGEPYWDQDDGHAEMLVTVPIRVQGRGRLLGAMGLRVNLRMLADTLRRFSPGESGQIYLMTPDGRIVVSSAGSSEELMQQRFTPDAAHWLLEREGRAIQFASFTKEAVVGSVSSVPALNWVMVSEIPAVEAYRQVARLRNVTLGIVTLLLAVVGALAYFLSMLIVRPVNRLTQAAANVAQGDLEGALPESSGGGEVGYLTKVFNDMVQRLRASRTELERLTVTDPLTGLFNRLRMMETLDNEVRRSRRLHHSFSVMMADVDLFKQYNDAHGHQAGDVVLKRIAAIMREASRDVDFVARYGGEEFLIAMPETGVDAAKEVAERIRARVEGERLPAGAIRLSIGVAVFPEHGDTPDALIAAADAALYQAKRAGGNRVVAAPRPASSVPAR